MQDHIVYCIQRQRNTIENATKINTAPQNALDQKAPLKLQLKNQNAKKAPLKISHVVLAKKVVKLIFQLVLMVLN